MSSSRAAAAEGAQTMRMRRKLLRGSALVGAGDVEGIAASYGECWAIAWWRWQLPPKFMAAAGNLEDEGRLTAGRVPMQLRCSPSACAGTRCTCQTYVHQGLEPINEEKCVTVVLQGPIIVLGLWRRQ